MNFSFQFVCSTQIKMYQESGFLGHFLDILYCRIAGASGGYAPWTHWGLKAPPRPLVAQGNDLWSLHILPSAGYHFHLCPQDKFAPPPTLNSLKKPVHMRYLSMPLLFSLAVLFLELACTGETSENCELHVSAVCLSLEKARKSFT